MAIQAELRLGIRDFKANLDRATAEVRKSAGTMKRETGGIGTALAGEFKNLLPTIGLASLGAAIKGALNRADDIADLTLKLNESAEAIQKVDYAATLSGSSVDQVADSMIKFERALGDVSNEKASAALSNLGITTEQLGQMSLDEKMVALADAFEQARASGTGVNDLQALLGKSSADLIPLLAQGGDALREMFDSAPVVAEETIQRMAEINDQFDALVMKSKSWVVETVGAAAGLDQFLGEFYAGILQRQGIGDSFNQALEKQGDRDVAALQAQAERERKRTENAKAQEAARLEADAKRKVENEAKAKEGAGKDIDRIKDQLEKDRIDILPDDQKIAELEAKLKEQLEGTVGMLGLNYDTSVEGLAKLAKAREADGRLPAEGQNSAKEAYEWLVAAKEIEEQIAAIKAKVADEEEAEREKAQKAAEKRKEELEDARKKAEEGGFALMTPEQQAAKLRKDLEGALGVEVKSSGDIDARLEKLRGRVAQARAEGDTEDEQAALQQLNDAQAAAKEFMDAAAGLAPDAPGGGVGSLAGLVNQMMGRDPQAMALEEAQRGNKIAEEQRKALDNILTKMDKQPPDVRFGRGF